MKWCSRCTSPMVWCTRYKHLSSYIGVKRTLQVGTELGESNIPPLKLKWDNFMAVLCLCHSVQVSLKFKNSTISAANITV